MRNCQRISNEVFTILGDAFGELSPTPIRNTADYSGDSLRTFSTRMPQVFRRTSGKTERVNERERVRADRAMRIRTSWRLQGRSDVLATGNG